MSYFNEMGLSPQLLSAINDLGFITPTPIQEKVIPAILTTKNDLVGLAQTGTGKTAAFGLPILQQTDLLSQNVQTLILCPTRELCMQINSDFGDFAKHLPGFKIVAVYGGASITAQMKDLKQNPQIVVGTPGRVLDMLHRKALKIKNIRWMVLDEADEMLDMGFKDDLEAILSETPREKRTMLFSATMPAEISRIAARYMNKPVEISVGKRNAGAENVKHEFYLVQAKDRYEALKRIADVNPHVYGIVFCRTRQETKEVADKLIQDGYNADALHGDLSQPQRDYVMGRFRSKHLQILVATDVAARGLDVNDLTHIINYNLPDELEIYVHRSGRTGRAGKNGISVSIIHIREVQKIRELEKLTQKKFDQKPVPSGKEICEKQLFNLVDKVENIEVNETQIDQFLPVIYKKLSWLSREDLIKHFVSVEFNRFLDYYKNAPDLNVVKPERHDKGKKEKINYSRFQINIGSRNKLSPARLMGLINEQTRKRHVEIGKIDILPNVTYFEINSAYENELKKAFSSASFEGVHLKIKFSESLNQNQSNSRSYSERRKKEKVRQYR